MMDLDVPLAQSHGDEADMADAEIALQMKYSLGAVQAALSAPKKAVRCQRCEEQKAHVHNGVQLLWCVRCLDEEMKGYYVKTPSKTCWHSYSGRCMEVFL